MAVNLSTFVVNDPVTEINLPKSWAIWQGGSQVSWVQNISTTYSDSAWNFNIVTPNPNIILNRKILIGIPLQLTWTGNSGNVAVPLIQYGVFDAFKPWPVNSLINTTTAIINNASISLNNNDIFPWLFWYHQNNAAEALYNSTSPKMLDYSQEYTDLDASPMNPLLGYTNGNTPHTNRRAVIPVYWSVNNSTNAQCSVFLIEEIVIPPFYYGKENEPGLIGVQNLQFNFNITGNMQKIWSHSTGSPSTINSFTVTCQNVTGLPPGLQSPTLYLQYITPATTMSIPDVTTYSYYEIQRYPTEVGLITSGSTYTFNSNNIQLNSIPNLVYIFLRQKNADLTPESTISFPRIDSVSLNFNNKSGLLSGATTVDLYKLSAKNGLQMSYQEWYGITGTSNVAVNCTGPGSILCLRFGSDIGLSEGEAPGVKGTYQFQCTVNGTYTGSINKNFTLYVVVVSEGVLTIGNNSASTQIGLVSPADIANTANLPKANYNELTTIYGRGGNFITGVKTFLTGIRKGVDAVAPLAHKAIDFWQNKVSPGLESMGVGCNASGGRRHKKRRHYGYGGGDLPDYGGGELLGLEELRKRARYND